MRNSVIVALAVLIASGVGYRALAGRYALLQAAVSLPRGTIEGRLPLSLGAWSGVERPLSDGVIQSTDTDDHVSRVYTRAGSRESVSLFIGYGIRLRDLMPHRPEVCYPGAGWTLGESRDVDLTLDGGGVLTCRVLNFTRGGLTAQRAKVLNYYLLDGTYCPDVSLLRSKSWRPDAAVRYVAQIQITATDASMEENASALVESFARDWAVTIREALNAAVAQAQPTAGN